MNLRLQGIPITLFAAKTGTVIGQLDYRRSKLTRTQARFAGRFAIQPVINLEEFKTKAVIDWISLRFSLARATQHQWLQREIEPIFGRPCYIENIDGAPNNSSSRFDIRFQEPEIATVLKVLHAIETRFGLKDEPSVQSVEISVDFTPKIPDDLQRARLVRVLMNHLQVRSDVTTNFRDRPRTVWGRGPDHTQRLLYNSKHLTATENNRFLLDTERDRAPYADGTLIIGEKEAEVRWRVMDKIIDRQNIAAETFVELDDKLKRARVEVTLGLPELKKIGVSTLQDLRSLSFTKLQGRYFQFTLPTFVNEPERASKKEAIAAASNQERASKFSKTGVIGLKAMDAAKADAKRKMRRMILPDLHAKGLRMKGANRNAQGANGSFVAYDELNERVRVALRNLRRRVVDGFSADT
ncbi:MAG: hypothetical protein AAGD15_16290 [Agrobacterium cavarae]|uniref:hypothetical protein n=1 Tax=Agrobacterium cavarae TaxID=2528239 RepID=UPI0031B16840